MGHFRSGGVTAVCPTARTVIRVANAEVIAARRGVAGRGGAGTVEPRRKSSPARDTGVAVSLLAVMTLRLDSRLGRLHRRRYHGTMLPPARFQEDLDRARAGDRAALDRLLAAIQGRLERIASGRLGPDLRSRVNPSDILQSAYLDVVRSLGQFEGTDEDAFVGWIARILDHNIADKGKYFEADRRRGRPIALERAADAHSKEPTPSRVAIRAEDLRTVSAAIQRLEEDYRRILLLRTVDGKSHREIAEAIGRSEAATRMLLSRARAALSIEIERLRGG